LSRQSIGPTSEAEMGRLLDDLNEATANLAGAPSISPEDLQTKLAILCARLRENLHLGDTAEMLSYLLAEAVREDFRVLLLGAVACKTRDRR
jgi:3-deoxy-D-arabino-heptulosonate 7-phosphate (DAHP) synthase class II